MNRLLVAIIGILIFSPGLTCAQITISILEHGSTDRRTIYLSDVANISVSKKELNNLLDLREIGISESASMGSSKFISLLEIKQRVATAFPGLVGKIKYHGSGFARVDSVGIYVEEEELTQVAIECIDNWLNAHFTRYKRKIVTHFGDVVRPKGDLRLTARKCDFELNDRLAVMVDMFVGGRLYQSYPINFEVEVFADVWVLTTDVTAETKLTMENLGIKQVNIAGYKGDNVGLSENIENLRTKRSVKARDVLTRTIVEAIPDVEKGSLVKVEASSGVVKVVLEALALQDGWIAQEISIKNISSERTFLAKVIEKNRVVAH